MSPLLGPKFFQILRVRVRFLFRFILPVSFLKGFECLLSPGSDRMINVCVCEWRPLCMRVYVCLCGPVYVHDWCWDVKVTVGDS